MLRTITGSSRGSFPASTASVWVTPSAPRNSGERKNCPGSEAAAPASSISRASAGIRVGRLILGEAAPQLHVDQLVAVPYVAAQHTLLLPAVVDDGLLGGLVGRRDPAVDLVRPELLVRLLVGQPLGLAADPLARHALVGDDRAELGRGLPAQPVQRRVAHRFVDPLELDRPLAVVPRGVHRPLDPVPRVLLAE